MAEEEKDLFSTWQDLSKYKEMRVNETSGLLEVQNEKGFRKPVSCLDKKGKTVIPFHDWLMFDQKSGMYEAGKEIEGKMSYGFYDCKGRVVIDLAYQTIRYLSKAQMFLIVDWNGNHGLLNKKGKIIIPVEYALIGYLGLKAFRVQRKDGLEAVFNREGIMLHVSFCKIVEIKTGDDVLSIVTKTGRQKRLHVLVPRSGIPTKLILV